MPAQTITIRQRGSGARATKGIGIFGFLWKHKFLFLTLFFMIPILLTVVKQTIEEKNPLIPVLVMGSAVLNADQLIYDDVQTLKENPDDMFILKDESVSLFGKIKYFFNRLWLVWKLTSNFWFIIVNIKLYYWLWKVSPFSDQSRTFINVTLGIVTLIVIMIFANLINGFIDIADGKINVNETTNNSFSFSNNTSYGKALDVFRFAMPFRGIISFIQFFPELLHIITIPDISTGKFAGIVNQGYNISEVSNAT